ncbi:chemotaxis protein CheB [Massilia sp. 2TAF26]|uniref:chemotaxis protein CheB n=1 Tax=Massilia sp. 2TAF26 TaxID=3233012 RepID=UPI003F9633D7
MIRILVVDDSPAVRELLAHIVSEAPGLVLAGCAADGDEALRMAHELRPDVVTMDVQMPKLNGFDATRRIMQECPTRVIIVSGTENQGEIGASFLAIEAGALMQVRRPLGIGNPGHAASARELVRAIRAMAEVRVVRRWGAAARAARPVRGRQRRLVLIGASTGGPTVLRDILAELPPGFALPVVMVQHLAPGFTRGLAEWLSSASGYPVALASDGLRLRGGMAHLVPDCCQPAIDADLCMRLTDGEPEHGMRPSVSHLFRALHPDLRADSVAILLSGMGRDGGAELKQLREDGALTIAQDRASAVVYGMPGEAVRLDAAMLVLRPAEIGKMLHGLTSEAAAMTRTYGI